MSSHLLPSWILCWVSKTLDVIDDNCEDNVDVDDASDNHCTLSLHPNQTKQEVVESHNGNDHDTVYDNG